MSNYPAGTIVSGTVNHVYNSGFLWVVAPTAPSAAIIFTVRYTAVNFFGRLSYNTLTTSQTQMISTFGNGQPAASPLPNETCFFHQSISLQFPFTLTAESIPSGGFTFAAYWFDGQ